MTRYMVGEYTIERDDVVILVAVGHRCLVAVNDAVGPLLTRSEAVDCVHVDGPVSAWENTACISLASELYWPYATLSAARAYADRAIVSIERALHGDLDMQRVTDYHLWSFAR